MVISVDSLKGTVHSEGDRGMCPSPRESVNFAEVYGN